MTKKSYYFNNTISHSPYFNLALEEYLLKNSNDNFFLLWQNEPSVVVGYHQNTNAEINLDYVKEKNIKPTKIQFTKREMKTAKRNLFYHKNKYSLTNPK